MTDLSSIQDELSKNDAINTLRERASSHRRRIRMLKEQVESHLSDVAHLKAEIAQLEASARQNEDAATKLEAIEADGK